jgi:hypothetical protein
MIDPELIRKINSGRCFVLVGSGPSSEIGYPSWEQLAKSVWGHVIRLKSSADTKSYERFMARKDYPAVFRQAETELGSRAALISTVRDYLKPRPSAVNRPIYEHLARWPFACYLTTNFDSELQNFLNRTGHHYEVVQNRVEDLALLRDGVSHLIIKLHSDFDNPDRIILTSQDYDKISTSPEWKPFRDKLRQALEVFDIVIIGHSITDPDLQLILSTAKHTASPRHPIFMFLANATDGEVREFLERYNIRLVPYQDTDNSHRELKTLMSVTNRFVVPRDAASPLAQNPNEDEILAASSLFIYRSLNTIVSEEPIDTLIGPLVLMALKSAGTPIARAVIAKSPAISTLPSAAALLGRIDSVLNSLEADGLVRLDAVNVSLTASGDAGCKQAGREKQLEEQQAYGQFKIGLKRAFPSISSPECEQAERIFRECVIGCFRARGLALANVIITEQSMSADDLVDLFRSITNSASKLSTTALKAAFVEAAHEFLIEPNEPQRKYLASVSQGFFLYHLAGADPSCAKIRRDLFADTCWFLDSSVLLPLLAQGSHNAQYASDFFSKLAGAKATLVTTHRLLKEAWYHLKWAIDFVKANRSDSPAYLMAALAKETFKQNLFIDGYIRLCADGVVPTFSDYLRLIFPMGATERSIIDTLRKQGIHAFDASDLKGFEVKHWGDIEDFKQRLIEERTRTNTYRGEFQVEAEGEALAIIRRLRSKDYFLPGLVDQPARVYFVSQSRALDKISIDAGVITWSPEAVYRYVTTLPGAKVNPDLLQQCMLNEYYYAGITFVDKARYLKFFGPVINQAKSDFRGQVDKYLASTEQQAFSSEYEKAFDRLPDLEKPFFVGQMGWQLARATEEKARMAERSAEAQIALAQEGKLAAEVRALTAEATADEIRRKMITTQNEANRRRNLQDPKHLKKRARQAKERQRQRRK